MLKVSGNLDARFGGPTIKKLPKYDMGGYEFNTKRRSVYVPAFRNSILGLFDVFDAPNTNLVTGVRSTSTLPTQSLYMMNSLFVIEQATDMAHSLV
jgi:hypothetical protein